jgi:hypothetical protein
MRLGKYWLPAAGLLFTCILWCGLSFALVPTFGLIGLGVVYLLAGILPFAFFVGPVKEWLDS